LIAASNLLLLLILAVSVQSFPFLGGNHLTISIMNKHLFWAVLLLASLWQQAWAQDRSISGKVTDRSNGQGLPGVTIIVKGQPTIGTSTNSDGVYAITVPSTASTLVYSFVGYATQEAALTGSGTVNIALATDTKQLNEVVVTALGVERTRNSLAYAATQVDGSDITVARNPNAINGLEGKVAGLSITQSNSLGGSSNVVIRGTKSVTGNNQALFVVDGVPISNRNESGGVQAQGAGGYDYGNVASDINPDDIASTTVLKGAAATALYGSRAANGVILITTKKGRRGLNVTVNSGVTMGRIDKSTFIKYQNQYGAGYSRGYSSKLNPYFNVGDNANELVVPTSEDASYGAAFDPNLLVRQWYSYTPGDPNYGIATPWVAAANGPETFFETAVSTLNTITVDGGNENGTFKLGYNNNNDKGILPNSKINKNIVNFAGSLNINPKLTLSTTVNFSAVTGLGRYGSGYSSFNPMANFREWWETNVDIKQLKEAYDRTGTNATWNYSSPETGDYTAIFWDNPYWTRYKNYETDSRYRTFGNVMANYKVIKGLEVVGRVTADSYDEMQEERHAVGSTTNDDQAYYSRYNHTYREFNYDLFANFNKSLGESFSLRGIVGANMRRIYNNSISAATNGGLVVPELYSLSNSAKPVNAPSESQSSIGVDGIFASATLGFRERVFLDLAIRRDKTTTLPSANNTYFYPSVALGYVFSEDLKDAAPWLSYGKVRANYAEVGNDAGFAIVRDVYRKPTGFGSVPLFAVPQTKNNPDLKPERTRSYEVGLESTFLNSRIGFEATAYQTSTINQIIPVNVSAATGYISRYVNSGEVRNRGLELSAFVVPVKTDNFNWRLAANWTKNQNRVMSLYQQNGVEVTNIVISSYQGGVSSNATVGQPYGVLQGSDYTYNDQGQRIVGPNGYYVVNANATNLIGNPNPNWRGGITNTFTYKSIALNFLIDIKSGGSVYSIDRYYGLDTGLPAETAGNNDLGNPSRNTLANGGGVILPGVKADGTPNDIRARNDNTSFTVNGYYRNPAAAFVYDASFVKLREVALSFGLPKTLLTKTPWLKGADLSVVGRNLWIIHKNLPDADPEDFTSSGNQGLGLQVGSYPAVRTLGLNLRLSL
jgi:TonB-linked SusC/RagA family outer membrane protein